MLDMAVLTGLKADIYIYKSTLQQRTSKIMETKEVKKSVKVSERMAQAASLAKKALSQAEGLAISASEQLEAMGDVMVRSGIASAPGLVAIAVVQASFTLVMSLIALIVGSEGLIGVALANLPVVLFGVATLVKKYKK